MTAANKVCWTVDDLESLPDSSDRNERLETSMDEAGHLIEAPELVIEVLSRSQTDKDRDRKYKLKL